MDNLYIVIPAYNEEINIEKVVRDWYPIVEKHNGGGSSRLLVIDDGSKDRTYEILNSMKESYPLLLPITKPNSGHGATILHGYRYAVGHGAKYIFQTDSDGQTLPEGFPQFWELRDQYAMVIGHRRKRQDGFSRVLVTKVLKFMIALCFGVNVTDANTPFRLMRADVLESQLDLIPDNFNLSNVMISVIYEKKMLGVKYLPITFLPRQGGVNSINMKKIISIGLQAVRSFTALNKVINHSENAEKKF